MPSKQWSSAAPGVTPDVAPGESPDGAPANTQQFWTVAGGSLKKMFLDSGTFPPLTMSLFFAGKGPWGDEHSRQMDEAKNVQRVARDRYSESND